MNDQEKNLLMQPLFGFALQAAELYESEKDKNNPEICGSLGVEFTFNFNGQVYKSEIEIKVSPEMENKKINPNCKFELDCKECSYYIEKTEGLEPVCTVNYIDPEK